MQDADEPIGKRLVPFRPELVPILEGHGHLTLDDGPQSTARMPQRQQPAPRRVALRSSRVPNVIPVPN